MLLLRQDHSAIMNDPDDFGFGDISPNTLEAEKQHEQKQQQEMNDPDDFGFGDVGPNTLEAEQRREQEQQEETNDPDDFGFGDISPNTLEAEQQQEEQEEQEMNDMDDFGFGDIAPTHWKQNINKNNNIIETHNEYWQPLLRRRDEGTQYRRNFVICATSDDNRRTDNPRGRHAML